MSTDLSPAGNLHAAAQHIKGAAPFRIAIEIAPFLSALDAYVDSIERRVVSIEARVRALDKMPSDAALDILTAAGMQ